MTAEITSLLAELGRTGPTPVELEKARRRHGWDMRSMLDSSGRDEASSALKPASTASARAARSPEESVRGEAEVTSAGVVIGGSYGLRGGRDKVTKPVTLRCRGRRNPAARPGGGASASRGASAAQQSVSARRPRYSVRTGSNHKGLLFFSNGSFAQLALEGTRRSSEGRGLGGPSSTSSRSALKTNQNPCAPAAAGETPAANCAGLVTGISIMGGL